MNITWYGTAAVSVETETTKLIFDPFVPWKGSKAPVYLKDFDGFSDVCVTHGHFDHIESLPGIIERNPGTKIYCTKTPCRTLREKGVPAGNLKKIGPGKQFVIGDIRIRTYQSRHADLQIKMKDRLPDQRLLQYAHNLPHTLYANWRYKENGEILMYELFAENKKVILLGSMNIADHVNYPASCDALILPYVGYLDNYSVADRIIKRLGPKTVILSHFDDTFPPITRTVDLSKIRQYPGCRIIVPEYKTAISV